MFVLASREDVASATACRPHHCRAAPTGGSSSRERMWEPRSYVWLDAQNLARVFLFKCSAPPWIVRCDTGDRCNPASSTLLPFKLLAVIVTSTCSVQAVHRDIQFTLYASPFSLQAAGAPARGRAAGLRGRLRGRAGPWWPEVPRDLLQKASAYPARPGCSGARLCQLDARPAFELA